VLSCNQRRAEPDGPSQKSRTEAYVIKRPLTLSTNSGEVH
jgi:hypothetical protein